MRIELRVVATAAFAYLLMPTFLLYAVEPANSAAGAKNDRAVDSSVATNADPGASLPAATMPMASIDAAMPYSGGMNVGVPRWELFVGYSYLRAVPTLAAGNRLEFLNGGSTSIAYNFNRYLGLAADFGGFNDTRLLLEGTGGVASVDDQVASGSVFTFLAGPRLSYRKFSRVTPYAQALFGGIHASAVEICPGNCSGMPGLPAETDFALTAGGGVDIKVRRRFAIRLLQAEYLMTSFKNLSTGSSATQNDMRLSSGIVFRFGGGGAASLPALEPLAYTCSVTPASGFTGDVLAVSGTAVNLNPAKTAVYTWSADGGTITGATNSAKIDTANAAPGSYTLKGHVTEADKASESADCSAVYVLKAYEPPTVGCSASPTVVTSGDSSTITAIGVSPQNRPLTYSFSAASGTITGNGSTAKLSSTGAALGTVNVTCNVADDKGQTATGATSVLVTVLAAAPKPQTSELCSVHFDRDPQRPSRVDNEAKACLDQIAVAMQDSSDTKLALVGNSGSHEKGGKKLAEDRAAHTKAYLVTDKGIDSSRIAVYTGVQDGKAVSATLIPSGAVLDTTGDTPVE
jgi:outer membrane protein OmpA-like peptidoglycan-associated protein